MCSLVVRVDNSKLVSYVIAGLVGNSMVISVLYVGGMLVSSGSISIGQLSSFMLYVVFTGTAVSGLSSFYTELMKGGYYIHIYL